MPALTSVGGAPYWQFGNVRMEPQGKKKALIKHITKLI
jgi:hypothetical protein